MHPLALAAAASFAAADLPTVEVTADNTPIDRSCRVAIPPGTVITDADGNGVLHVRAPGITVEFSPGSVLRGAPAGTPWDALSGTGVRIEGAADVTLRNLRVHGFRAGVHATDASGLTIDTADLSDNYRQRLRSTPTAEDPADWLWPHRNDANEWLDRYGAALYIEDADDVTVRNVRVRRGQNGIVLDRVAGSRVYDNDASFLSGWGLAMWRSSGNTISRNALDFCVRGHSEGVYNRGQDSAGILLFEQCSNNVFAENSATHGGDGVFGFAGREAIGEMEGNPPPENAGKPAGFFVRIGCNDNLFIDNDLSYAPAHGLELTFSEGNRIIRNRFVENAGCGIWGGYSSETLIALNTFERNGGMAAGPERGAINIEHGAANRIVRNAFTDNRCGVHLWWDDDAGLLRLPGVSTGYRGVADNVIAANTFTIASNPAVRPRDGERLPALQIRDASGRHVRGTVYAGNTADLSAPGAVEFALDPGVELTNTRADIEPRIRGDEPWFQIPEHAVLGDTRPVGARAHLAGRHAIVMTEWGPWDHESTAARPAAPPGDTATIEVFGARGPVEAAVESGEVRVTVEPAHADRPRLPTTLSITPPGRGVFPYRLRVTAPGFEQDFAGTLVSAPWRVRFWGWQADPLEDPEAWRAEGDREGVAGATLPALRFNYGSRGPSDLALTEDVTAAGLPRDRFGMIATTAIPLSAGLWRLRVLSDDGVRVSVDGRSLIERWDIHAPLEDAAEFRVEQDREVEITVEHFEHTGAAVLTVRIEPAAPRENR